MPPQDARSDWKTLAPEAIASKSDVGLLEIMLAEVMATLGGEGHL